MVERVYCSFCGRSDIEAFTIVKADDCAICDECVDVATEVIIQRRRVWIETLRESRAREAMERETWAGTGP